MEYVIKLDAGEGMRFGRDAFVKSIGQPTVFQGQQGRILRAEVSPDGDFGLITIYVDDESPEAVKGELSGLRLVKDEDGD